MTGELKTEQPRYQASAAAIELLYQLADDDFILSYRGSEWLGLAPHIEEDVAFSSISQDTMGHAAMFYQILEEMGEGKSDDLAHLRKADERRNSILAERANGPGHYLQNPQYDWAFAVVRNFFYVYAKKVKMESLKTSSFLPLRTAAVKISMELHYHLLHWKTWFLQLMQAGGEARRRMEEAASGAYPMMGDVLCLGPLAEEMQAEGLIDGEEQLLQNLKANLAPVFEASGTLFPSHFGLELGNGREGQHTKDITEALATLSEVYRSDPAACW
jgi:ring-1,2-phenylacetyl-CoA epoxidase subunit PaaC